MVDSDTFDYTDIEIVNYDDKIDFDADLEELDKMTKSIRVEWKVRESALKKIAGICLGNYKKNETFLKYFNNKFYKNLNAQFKEKRSIIIRETCRIISFCIKVEGIYIEKAIINIISNQNIFLLIEKSENSVSVEYASLCIFNIIRYLKSEKIIDIICNKKDNKSDKIRILCAKCILLFLKEYPLHIITQKLNLFYEIFNKYLIDINSEVKSIIRFSFFEFKKILPSEAGIYFNSLEKKIQREIIDEEKFSKNLLFYKTPNKNNINEEKTIKNENNNLNKSNIINDDNNLIYSMSYISKNKEVNKSFNTINNNKKRNLYRGKKLYLSNNNDNKKKLSSQKFQLERLNNKLMQLNIITGNDEDYFKHNPDNISDYKLKELQKLNIVEDNILNRRERNIDKSIINDNYMLIEEKLLVYLYKLEKCTTSQNKLVIFEYIYNDFESILHGIDKISKLTLRKFVDIHVKNLIDIDNKLVEQIIKNLMRMIYYMEKIFENYNIESIVKILITHISSGNEQIILLSRELLNIIRQKFDNEEIFKALYDLLKEGDNDICDISYQYLYFIIPNCELILNDEANFKKLFKLICLSDKKISKSIGNIIKFIYKNYKLYFNAAFEEENKENQDNIISIMEKSKCSFVKIFKEKYKEMRLNELEEEELKEEQKLLEIKQKNLLNNNDDDLKNIPFEIINSIKTGDIKLFINYIDNNISYIPEFLLLLSNPKFNGSIYSKNLVNFTFVLLSYKKYIDNLNSCVELITNQIIHLFLTNTNNVEIINTIKDILNILPFKLDSKKFVKSISNYFNNNTDIILLQSLLICLKNFIQNNKHENLEELLPCFIDNLLKLFNHSMEEIRKHAVECCAQIYSILGHKFDSYLTELPKNQQNWIQIFVKK